MIQQSVDETGTLVVEWDNRRLTKSRFMTVFFPLSWIAWVAMTILGTYEVAMDEPGTLRIIMGLVGLTVACGIAIGMPVVWLMRYSRERVEISNTEYRHSYSRFPRLFPKKWPTVDISRVEIGHHVDYDERESMVSLSIWKEKKRDIVGYWVSDDLKHELFEIITKQLRANGCGFEIVDNFSDGN